MRIGGQLVEAKRRIDVTLELAADNLNMPDDERGALLADEFMVRHAIGMLHAEADKRRL